MFLKITFLLFASCYIANCKFLENWTKMKVKFEPSPALLDGPMRLRVYSNGQMAIPVQIGTPPQHFNLSLSLMMSNAILYLNPVEYVPPSKADPQTYRRNIFVPKASSTFKNFSEEYSNIAYGSGYFASDNMNLLLNTGKEGTKQMDIMVTTKNGRLTYNTFVNIPADGFLGLAPIDSTYGLNTFTQWLMDKMGTNSTKMTFYFEKFNPQDPEEMAQNSFAIVDLTGKSTLPEFCNEQKWFYADKPPLPSISLWMLIAQNIYIESKNGPTKIFDQNASLVVSNLLFFTIIPEKKMNMLAEILNVKLPCNATKNAPTMKFEFVNEKREKMFFEFQPEDYILPSKSGNCFLTFVPLSAKMGEFYVLGYSFFKDHCLQLNLDDKYYQQIGLAPKLRALNERNENENIIKIEFVPSVFCINLIFQLLMWNNCLKY